MNKFYNCKTNLIDSLIKNFKKMSTPVRYLVNKTVSPVIFKSPTNLSLSNRNNKTVVKDLSIALDDNVFNKEEKQTYLTVKNERVVPSLNTPDRNKFLKKDLSKIKLNILGKGAFGVVFQGEYKGENVAMKLINNKTTMNQECNILKLSHPNVLSVFFASTDTQNAILMQSFAQCDLQRMLNLWAPFSIDIYGKWSQDICKGLQHCHQNGILHLDVKPKNILIKNNNCMLCDFGSSLDLNNEQQTKWFKQKKRYDITGRTIAYTAPELLQSIPGLPTPAVDVYSLGITMWQLQTGCNPYQHLDNVHSIIYQVVKNKLRPKISQISKTNCKEKEFQELYKKCWVEIPKDRLNIENVLENLKNILI